MAGRNPPHGLRSQQFAASYEPEFRPLDTPDRRCDDPLMIHLAEEYEDLVPVPRAALELPLPLPLPPGFDPDRLETWPKVAGRLEYPPDPELPGLTPPVDDLFEQVSRRPDT